MKIGADDPDLAREVQARYDEEEPMAETAEHGKLFTLFGMAWLFARLCCVVVAAGAIAQFGWWLFRLGWNW